MFMRVVELTAKEGNARELCNAIQEKALPILRKHSPSVELIACISQHDPENVISISFWNNRREMERYQQEDFTKIVQIVSDLLAGPPRVKIYNVATSSIRQIATGRAA